MTDYVLKTPDAPATFKQGIKIRRLTGDRDIRKEGLTMKQASDIIAQLMAGNAVLPKTKTPKVSSKKSFETILKDAESAANSAGDAWLEAARPAWVVVDSHGNDLGYAPMLDVCGIVYIAVVDKRTSFAKWLATHQDGYNGSVLINNKYKNRQEKSLCEDCCRAAIEVMTRNGIKGIRLYSRID